MGLVHFDRSTDSSPPEMKAMENRNGEACYKIQRHRKWKQTKKKLLTGRRWRSVNPGEKRVCGGRREGEGSGGDGVGLEDLRGDGGGGIAGPPRVGGSVVPQPKAVQGVRGEAGPCPDPLQPRLRLLLQPLPARPL